MQTRQKIYNSISKNPGIHYSEISRHTKIPKTTLLYHIRYLDRIGLIKKIKNNGYTRLFVKDEQSSLEKKLLFLLRQKVPCKILIQLLFSWACSRRELSKELELPPTTVKYYLDKMLEMGIIEKAPVKDGYIKIYPAEYSDKYLILEKKPVGREVFYRRKEYSELRVTTYKLMVSHKDSLADKELIQTYVEYLNRLDELGVTGKNFKENGNKKVIIKDGKKNEYPKLPNENSIWDFLLDIFKPPFAA